MNMLLKIVVLLALTFISTASGVTTCPDPVNPIPDCIASNSSLITPDKYVNEGETITIVLVTQVKLFKDIEVNFYNGRDENEDKYCDIPIESWESGTCNQVIQDAADIGSTDTKYCTDCTITTQSDGTFQYSLTVKNISHYESGSIDIQKIYFSNETLAKAISFDYPDFTVAVPPANLTISGLDSEMSYNPDRETLRIVNCIAAYTRPPPVFHWSIEDHYLTLNMTVLEQTKTQVTFPKNSYPAGKAWTVTQPIQITVDPHYDGKELRCTVEHMGYNSSVTEEDRTVSAFMTVKGPPIPAEDTLNIQGDFIMGEPATLYIPFHAYPVPTKMVFYLADMDIPLIVGQGGFNITEAGRYSTEGWVQEDSRNYFAVLQISELMEKDRTMIHTVTVTNQQGSTNYTFGVTIEEAEVDVELRCPQYGFGCHGTVLKEYHYNDWSACAKYCLEERSCVNWRWDTLDHPDNPGRCCLMSSCTVKEGYQWITGSYDCYSHYFFNDGKV